MRLPFLVVTLALPVAALAVPQQQGNTCRLVDAAAQNQVITAGDSAEINDKVFSPPEKPTQMACLSSVIGKGGDQVLTIPSIADVADGLLDRACDALEDGWNKTTSKINESVSLPYGLIEIAGSGGYRVNIPGAQEGVGNSGIGDAIGGVNSGAGQVGDAIDRVRDREKDAVDRTQDSVNIYGGGTSGSIYQ